MRKHILFLSTLIVGSLSFAQNATNSPYSSYGLGLIDGLDHAQFLGLGNSRITGVDSTVLNFYNPASYNAMAKGQPLFSLGVSSRLSTYAEGSSEYFSPTTSMHHLALGFSFAKHFGAAAGIKPYSLRGYDITSGTTVGTDSLVYKYQGTGGINEAFLGFSANVLNTPSTRISFGVNGGWLFGSSTNVRKSGLYSSSGVISGGVNTKILDVRSLHYDLGFYATHKFNQNHSLGVFATYDPKQNLSAEYEDVVYYSADVDNQNAYDTLTYAHTTNGTLTSVPELNYGIRYTLRLTSDTSRARVYQPELQFHATYGTQDWSAYENTFDADTTNFLNTSRFTFGIQYIPDADVQSSSASKNILTRMRYRAGFYTYSLPYSTGGEQVRDFGTTFGIGIPVAVHKTLSSVNFGFSYGRRGVSDSQLLNERYYGVNVGVTIAPGNADKWFRKRKLN